jgi:hypothetical protein
LVSVSTTMNSAAAIGAWSNSTAVGDTPGVGRLAGPLAGGRSARLSRRLIQGVGSRRSTRKEGRSPILPPTASDTEILRELDADTRQAWSNYSGSVRELAGEEYERVESESWSELQTELERLERRRERLKPAAA